MDEHKVKSSLREAISDFCHWRVAQGICDDNDCEFCCVNEAYDMAREDEPAAEDGSDDDYFPSDHDFNPQAAREVFEDMQ